MVSRCGFFIKDNKLCHKDVLIDWDLGFDRQAKQEYIKRIQDELAPLRAIDVTTASLIYEARHLSPIFVDLDEVTKVEELYGVTSIIGAVEYYYLNALTSEQVAYVIQQECFIDVFHNPVTKKRTQAEALAVMQLIQYNNLDILRLPCKDFVKWYQGIVSKTVIC